MSRLLALVALVALVLPVTLSAGKPENLFDFISLLQMTCSHVTAQSYGSHVNSMLILYCLTCLRNISLQGLQVENSNLLEPGTMYILVLYKINVLLCALPILK